MVKNGFVLCILFSVGYPSFGRFISVDPERELHNPYSYVANSPLKATDPTGKLIELVFILNDEDKKAFAKRGISEYSVIEGVLQVYQQAGVDVHVRIKESWDPFEIVPLKYGSIGSYDLHKQTGPDKPYARALIVFDWEGRKSESYSRKVVIAPREAGIGLSKEKFVNWLINVVTHETGHEFLPGHSGDALGPTYWY
ncbi:hypothetical protein SCOR_27215 [Sulfidibacter corallicola]